MSHDVLAWDDDVDMIVDVRGRDFLRNATRNRANTTLWDLEYMKRNYVDKIWFKYAPNAGRYKWKYPFIDISFYDYNDTTVWMIDKNKFTIPSSYFFPLNKRPLGNLWLKAPHNPVAILQSRYKRFKCQLLGANSPVNIGEYLYIPDRSCSHIRASIMIVYLIIGFRFFRAFVSLVLNPVFVVVIIRAAVEVFKSVCGAVAKRAKQIATESGFTIRHAAVKFRNPAHAATPEERTLMAGFEQAETPEPIEGEITVDGKRYFKFISPIYVERSCLACHGPKDKRPAFIVKKYPDDRAYGFAEGDLRGIISVSFPLE